MEKMKYQACTNPKCKNVKLTVVEKPTNPMHPMVLVCENCGKEHHSLPTLIVVA